MNVPLSGHRQRFIREGVRSGRSPSEAAVLEEALALQDQTTPTRHETPGLGTVAVGHTET